MYVFGPFRLDVGERVLTCDGQPVPLTLKAFETLLLLVRNRGHVVTKEQIPSTVWADSFVGDAVLEGTIRLARGRIRLLLQLVGSQTGTTLWAEQFDEAFTDIFSVEDCVTEQVMRALLTQLTW